MPEVASNDEKFLPTADLEGLVWSEEPVPVNWEYLCIHQLPRPATPPPQTNQVEIPPDLEQMDIDILEDLPDVINVPKELSSDISYQL